MDSRRDLALVVGLVVAIVGIAFVAAPDPDQSSFDERASTLRVAGPGTYALHRTLRALGIPVEQRLTSWVDGPPLEGTLVLLAPPQPLTPFETAALVTWVEEGGTLIVAGDPFPQAALLVAFGLSMAGPAGAPQTAVPAAAHPWVPDGAVVDGVTRTFADAAPAFERGEAVVLLAAGRPQRPVLVLLRRGEGQVVAWSDARPLTNAALRSSGAALIFARAARDLTDDAAPLVFGEFHHGYREGAGPARATLQFLARTPPGWMALQLMVAAIALLWLQGRRFGAAHEPPPARRRSPLEHVDALAGAYQGGGARLTARRLIVAGLARRLGTPVPPPGTEHAWFTALARRSASVRPHAEAMYAEWQRAAQTDLVALARHADAIVAEGT